MSITPVGDSVKKAITDFRRAYRANRDAKQGIWESAKAGKARAKTTWTAEKATFKARGVIVRKKAAVTAAPPSPTITPTAAPTVALAVPITERLPYRSD